MKYVSLSGLVAILLLSACTDSASVPAPVRAPASAPTSVSGDNCAHITLPCQGTASFSVIGTTDESQRYLDVMQRAAGDYQTHFNADPVLTAVVMSSELTPAVQTELERAGYVVVLPWLDFSAKRELEQQAITQQLAEQIKHLPEAAQAQAMESLKAQLGAASPALSVDKENGALAHELGHLWFIDQFPDPVKDSGINHAYGGWAPDWLDESAAVLMENAVLRDERHEGFKDLDKSKIIELETFLSMEHPLAQAAKNLVKNSDPKDGPQVVFLTGDKADEFLEESGQSGAGDFYLQVSAFTAFMIEHTGDPAVFASIASHLSGGSDFSNWVERSGHFKNLTHLGEEWQNWINDL